MTLGQWQSGPAWSTIKVPLVIAALREEQPPIVTDAMTAAITESDNAAAESIWASLGDPVTAAHKVDAVLRATGDPTDGAVAKSAPGVLRVRPDGVAVDRSGAVHLSCSVRHGECAGLRADGARSNPTRGGVSARVPGSRFKGGWGPSPTGSYLVRQMGVLAGPTGMIAVALAAQPASGKFDDGIAALTEMATWLTAHLSALPAGHCGS